MRCLVTGGAGFIGTALANRLVEMVITSASSTI